VSNQTLAQHTEHAQRTLEAAMSVRPETTTYRLALDMVDVNDEGNNGTERDLEHAQNQLEHLDGYIERIQRELSAGKQSAVMQHFGELRAALANMITNLEDELRTARRVTGDV
jgi:peptidoglycan hydrolase CwlO-like protein